ncbi:MAG: hypothetical protein E7620_08615 [Ruminococcaceae bacterium]|nr:hypothetical protein [Oscillospiraceae bacterium]
MLKYDPIEDTPEFQAIKEELDKKIIARIGEKHGMGYCHLYWSVKRNILKKDYGIEWRSPAEMNPGVLFD